MRVLIVGSGGREHALAWAFARSPLLGELHAAPGNPGIGTLARLHPVQVSDLEGMTRLAAELDTDLVVIGPEAPLVAGLADRLAAAGIAAFGPSAAAAQLEGSKAFAKTVMATAGVPTARFAVCDTVSAAHAAIAEADGDVVVKADGLAAGKGVVVCSSTAEAHAAVAAALVDDRFGVAGRRVLIEERLEGEELSLLALCDGEHVMPLAPARDFKRAGDDDSGPNTGGMGSISPVPGIDAEAVADIVAGVHRPVVNELARLGSPFRGCLYAGLIMTADGPRVIEFNVRFGDPETQVILPRTGGDLLALLARAAGSSLAGCDAEPAEPACVSVVVASRGYPEAPELGDPIAGIDAAEEIEGVTVFHAGTAQGEAGVQTAGGRVLNVTAVGPDFDTARRRAYSGVDAIRIAGSHHRTDIGRAAADAERVHA
ncbi:MAG TPA: phosphoribosylamine--glycine ligase [Gaiellales bacterium]|jgi:phosphoribosylamine--glycine ligase